MQSCRVNGWEYRARRLDKAGIGYEKRDNCFTRIDDIPRAQKMLDALVRRKWPWWLNRLARQSNLHFRQDGLLANASKYWTFRETERATDVMFQDNASSAAIYPSLVRHAIEQFVCADVLRFLGRRTTRKGRRYRGLRPIDSEEARLFAAVLSGQHHVQGFRSAHLEMTMCHGAGADGERQVDRPTA